jgi:diaminopimelate epimerase
MEPISFFKMSGSGNDFIIIDNRNGVVEEKGLSKFISSVCRRKMSVGADGFILLEEADNADFKWRFFNSDGNTAEMCGNGARCVARFAYLNAIANQEMSFETEAGIISAWVSDGRVKIKVPDPSELKMDYTIESKHAPIIISSVDTGVPHVVIEVENIDNVEVVSLGREIRFHKTFEPAGTNVNFSCPREDGKIAVRTYERGVEDETLACGTGAIASAVVFAHKFKKSPPINVITRSGGCLTIYFKEENGQFYDVYLEGDARVIYKGVLWEDAFNLS